MAATLATSRYVADAILGPSHRVEDRGDDVLIRDLEVFVGYIPDVDGENKRFRKYDDAEIDKILSATAKRYERGSRTKMILRHNDDPPAENDRPVVGDFVNGFRKSEIAGSPGIIGDVLMSREDFEAYVKSNRYPRRSIELHPDGHLSEVALLGSETPARPLPDTRFSSDRGEVVCADRAFVFSMADPGPTSGFIPKGTAMPNNDDKKPEGNDEMAKLKQKIAKLEEENKELKKAKAQNDDEEKDVEKAESDDEDKKEKEKAQAQTEKALLQKERDGYKEQFSKMQSEVQKMRSELLVEKFSNKFSEAEREGYDFGDSDRKSELMKRVVNATDPDAEFDFYKKGAPQIPLNTNVVRFAASPQLSDDGPDMKTQEEARKNAVERCTEDSSLKFKSTYEEELAKLKG